MAKISGIYVEIRGDAKQLKKELASARQAVTQQAHGMSDALNNALSPAQLKNSINGLVKNLNQLSQASKVTGKDFAAIGADLGGLQRLTGLSAAEFGKLQSKMMQTQAAKAQEQALRGIAKAAGLTNEEIQKLGASMNVSQAGINSVIGKTQGASDAMGGLVAIGRTAAGVFGGMIFAKLAMELSELPGQVIQAGIAFDSLERSMYAVTGSATAAAETLGWIREEADRLGQNFYTIAPEFKNIAAAARGTAMEGEEVRKLFSAIVGASTALGLSMDDTHGTLRALQQMMSKGKIQAEELRGQLGERLPGALKMMADGMGVTTAQLNKMMEDGKLLADDALPKLTEQINKMYKAAAENAALESGQAAVNRLSKAWTDLKVNLYDAEAFVFATNKVTGLVNAINKVVSTKDAEGRLADLEDRRMQLKKSFGGSILPGSQAAKRIPGYDDFHKQLDDVERQIRRTKEEIQWMTDPAKDGFMAMSSGAEKAATRASVYTQEVDKGREALAKYIQTAREKAKADYDAAVRFANSKEEEAKALAVYQEAIARLDKREAGAADAAARAMEKLQAEIAKMTLSAADFEHYQIDQEFAKIAKEIGAANPMLAKWVTLRREEAELMRGKSVEKELDDYFSDIDKKYADLIKQAEKNAQENEEILLDFSDRYREIVVGETEFKKEQIDRQAEIFRKAGADEVAVAQWVEAEKLKVSREWSDGVQRGLADYADSATNAAQLAQDAITGGFKGMEDALVDFVTTGKMNFADFADSVIKDMARIAIQQSITGPLASAAGGFLSNLFSPSVAPSVASVGAPKVGYAKGGVFAAGLSQWSNTVQDSPKFFDASGLMPFAKGGVFAEAGPEAIMPLSRDASGRLGVRASGGMPSISVNIYEAPGKGGQVEQSQGQDGSFALDIFFDQIDTRLAANIAQGRGATARALSQRTRLT